MTLPQRFFNEELKTGSSKGEKSQNKNSKMLNKYYRLKEEVNKKWTRTCLGMIPAGPAKIFPAKPINS
jgi:aldehyde:ferredoxin oxidoreductase